MRKNTETEATETLADMEAAVNAAKASLASLRAEQKQLPQLIASAARRGDSAGMIKLKRRQIDLVAEIFAAHVCREQGQIDVCEAKLAIGREEQAAAEQAYAKRAPELDREWRETEARLKDLRIEYLQLAGEQDMKQRIARELAQELDDKRRALQAFIEREAAEPSAVPKAAVG